MSFIDKALILSLIISILYLFIILFQIDISKYFIQDKKEIDIKSEFKKKADRIERKPLINNQKTPKVVSNKQEENIFFLKSEDNITNIYIKKDFYKKKKNNGTATDTRIEVNDLKIFIFYNSSSNCKSQIEGYDCFVTKKKK